MALLFCHLLLLSSKTLLPAERPQSYSGGTSYPAYLLQAGSRHQEWTGGGGMGLPPYKHTLLVNLDQRNFCLGFLHYLFLQSKSLSAPACLPEIPGSCRPRAGLLHQCELFCSCYQVCQKNYDESQFL